MDESAVLCVAIDEGVECAAEAVMVRPVPLCEQHRIQVALLVAPDALTTLLRQAKTGMSRLSLPADERAAVIAGARPKAVGAYMGGIHGPVVYFLENGSRVKIGHSTNLRSRVKGLALQEKDVCLLLQGGLTLERALHSTFAKDRIDATEWFVKSEKIVEFIESKRSKLADPDARSGRKRLPRQRIPASVLPVLPSNATPRLDDRRRSPVDWAELAAPLYREYEADHNGSVPSAPVLVNLLRSRHPGLRYPESERAWRNIRSATEGLIAEQGRRSGQAAREA